MEIRSHSLIGGYPIVYLDNENKILCPKCAKESFDIVNYFCNWEDNCLYCDNCSERIESAYCD